MPARAEIRPGWDAFLPEVISGSDLIVTGTITGYLNGRETKDYGPGGPPPPRNVPYEPRTITFHIDAVLRGQSGAQVISVDPQCILLNDPGFKVGGYWMLFLVRAGDGYQFTSTRYPFAPARADEIIRGAIPMISIEKTIAAAIAPGEGFDAAAGWSLAMLATDPSPNVVPVLEPFLNDPRPWMRESAILSLTFRGDPTATAAASALLTDASTAPELHYQLLIGLTSPGSPTGIQYATSFMKSADEGTRMIAVRALGDSRSKLAIAPLGAALDDPSIMVRTFAMIGLAHLTDQLSWVPSDYAAKDYPQREQYYLAYWKNWLRQNQ